MYPPLAETKAERQTDVFYIRYMYGFLLYLPYPLTPQFRKGGYTQTCATDVPTCPSLFSSTPVPACHVEYVMYTARAVPYDAMDHHDHTAGREGKEGI